LFNVLQENYASYRVKPERPAKLLAVNYSEYALTKYSNNNVKAYNKFLLAQVFKAATPENVRKLLFHKDLTCLTVGNAYQTFTEHRVEADKHQSSQCGTRRYRRTRPSPSRTRCGRFQAVTMATTQEPATGIH